MTSKILNSDIANKSSRHSTFLDQSARLTFCDLALLKINPCSVVKYVEFFNHCDWRMRFVIIIIIIITGPSEKLHKKICLTSQLSEPLIRSNGLCLCKISSMMSQFSTNKRTFFLFCCFLFAVFNNCWSTRINKYLSNNTKFLIQLLHKVIT